MDWRGRFAWSCLFYLLLLEFHAYLKGLFLFIMLCILYGFTFFYICLLLKWDRLFFSTTLAICLKYWRPFYQILCHALMLVAVFFDNYALGFFKVIIFGQRRFDPYGQNLSFPTNRLPLVLHQIFIILKAQFLEGVKLHLPMLQLWTLLSQR